MQLPHSTAVIRYTKMCCSCTLPSCGSVQPADSSAPCRTNLPGTGMMAAAGDLAGLPLQKSRLWPCWCYMLLHCSALILRHSSQTCGSCCPLLYHRWHCCHAQPGAVLAEQSAPMHSSRFFCHQQYAPPQPELPRAGWWSLALCGYCRVLVSSRRRVAHHQAVGLHKGGRGGSKGSSSTSSSQ